MQRIDLEPGMRVRCVDAILPLVAGNEYTVLTVRADTKAMVKLKGLPLTYSFFADRFKPVVRVKARCTYSGSALVDAVARAIAIFNALPPEQQAAHRQAQRESWVRGEMASSRMEHG